MPLEGGMVGSACTGLHYPSLYPLLDRSCPDPDDWDDMLTRVQACEDGALTQMQANR